MCARQVVETLSSEAEEVQLTIKRADLDMLLRLQEAGVISSFDGLSTRQVASKLVDWTMSDLSDWLIGSADLKAKTSAGVDSTAMNMLRRLRYLEKHPCPVQLRPPDEGSWIKHVAYRRTHEGATNVALNHYRRALKHLLEYLELPEWRSLKKFTEPPTVKYCPTDQEVVRLVNDTHHPDPYLRTLGQYATHFAVYTGVRPPTELTALRLDDIEWDSRTIIIRQEKKGGAQRLLYNVPRFVLSSKVDKSLRNWVEAHRPRYDKNGASDRVFLSKQGRAYYPNSLAVLISEMGKQINPRFHPYACRRWFATNHLIEHDFAIHLTARAIGDTEAVVRRHYLDEAQTLAAILKRGGGHDLKRRRREAGAVAG